jgi:DNA (cytosine-5)-methyltransferase 1
LKIFNHLAPGFSDLEWEMVKHIPEGGNWKNIPESVPSKRLEQIRKSGGRTTYYGRLRRDKPSYTISTYFNRLGNGCNLHPDQNRLISIREGARLQSFKDDFIFHGPKTSQYKQIGNAVPPLLSRVIAESLEPFLNNKNFIDLFSGAGGLSEGFIIQNYNLIGSVEIEKHFFTTFFENHGINKNGKFLHGDITENNVRNELVSITDDFDVELIVGGPPCQGFSTAGCRNPNDKRNKLFNYFVDCVNRIKPEIFVMENVPGLLSMQKGEVINEIKSKFEKIGYNIIDPFKLNAEEFGVPQRRKRIFIIGSRNKIRYKIPEPLFSENNNDLPKPITVKDAIFNLPPLNAGEGGMELEFNNEIKPCSSYEEYIMGKITFSQFYKSMVVNETLI